MGFFKMSPPPPWAWQRLPLKIDEQRWLRCGVEKLRRKN